MVLHFQNAALCFDASFSSIPRYWRRARDHMQMHHTNSAPARIVLHQQGFVKSAILCSLGCSYKPTTQTSSKIDMSTCVAWKAWTQNCNYNTAIYIFFKSISMVVVGQLSRVRYMDYGVIIIKPNLTLPTT